MNATIRKTLYLASPGGCTTWCRHRYLGPDLRREEERSDEYMDDFHMHYRRRYSEDNGRTWAQWTNLPDPPMQNGMQEERWTFATLHDPRAGRTVQMIFQRLFQGHGDDAIKKFWREKVQTFFDHAIYQLSDDGGRTWAPPRALRYEAGPDFDPTDWSAPDYLKTNQMYGGYTLIQTRDDALLYPATRMARHRNADGTEENVSGLICLRGVWDAAAEDYRWEASGPVTIPLRLSGRGLMEPTLAELRDGRILVCMRGASTYFGYDHWKGKVESPGRCWITTSADGGRTWAPIGPLTFDTGAPCHVPDALCRLLRSRLTGKLYWFGNLSPTPIVAEGGPRRPLVMAEVEETGPSLKADTVTVIADRDPARDSDQIQFSNFGLLENRETGAIELLMSHFGENSPLRGTDTFDYTADTYLYTLMPI